MTIVLGFSGNDGVVLAADSQETVPGYTKDLTRGKIIVGAHPCGSDTRILISAIAGAGWADYIEMAREKISNALGGCKDIFEVERAMDECLRQFYDERIAPWALFREHQQPTVELLIAISLGEVSALFHYQGTAFYRCYGHKAIGSGAILANTLLHDYCYDVLTLDDLIPLAAYVLYKVKESAEGCGGFSQIIPLRQNGDFAIVEGVKEFEAEIEKLEQQTVAEFRTKLVGASTTLSAHWIRDRAKP